MCSKRFSLAKLCMSGRNYTLHPTAAMSLFRWTSGGTFWDRQVGASRLTITRTRPAPKEAARTLIKRSRSAPALEPRK